MLAHSRDGVQLKQRGEKNQGCEAIRQMVLKLIENITILLLEIIYMVCPRESVP